MAPHFSETLSSRGALHPHATTAELCFEKKKKNVSEARCLYTTPMGQVSEEECRQSMMVWIYPGFVVAQSPNSAVYMSITPTGPTDLQVRWDVIARPETFEDGEAKRRFDFAASFNVEDRERLLDVQKGLSSRFAARGFLAPADLEGTVWDFYQYMSEKLIKDDAEQLNAV